jgi:putative ABC transport system permease protein
MLKTIIRFAIKSLIANKMRSFLAMLGIIIGVASVISLLSLAAGVEKEIMSDIEDMGTNILTIRPNTVRKGGTRMGSWRTLKIEDVYTLSKRVKEIEEISPSISSSYQVKYLSANDELSIQGVITSYFRIWNAELEKGRIFDEDESESFDRICVIGANSAKTLFGSENPIGEEIKIKGLNFKVIGSLKKKGDKFGSTDDEIYIPYKVLMKQMMGIDFVRSINLKLVEKSDVKKVIRKISGILRMRHKIEGDKADDFKISSMDEFIAQAQKFSTVFTFLLGGIASISLLVGGIGIMNIMLVTVTERIKEIGIRKAIGAKNKDILNQFLIEAVVMTTTGGIIGILLGYGISTLLSFFMPFQPVVKVSGIIISLSFSACVGIFFGYYPARKASKLDPIESLRYE